MLHAEIDTILFDAGGTLVRIDYEFIAELGAGMGIPVELSRFAHGEAAARHGVDARLRGEAQAGSSDADRRSSYFEALLRGTGLAPEAARELAQAVDAAHLEANLWRVPFADSGAALERLERAGIPRAVVSNGDGRVHGVLEAAGLTPHLAFVLDSFDEGVEKPDPKIFELALARIGAKPERTAYVGDIYSVDVLGARSAGLAACLLDPTDSYAGADCERFKSLSELLDRLEVPR